MIIDAPTLSQIPALRSLWKEAFGDTDAFLDGFFATAFSPSRCFCMQSDEKIVAALYWFDCRMENQKIAYLYAIATAKDYRGRGLCQQLMAHTHAHLQACGYAGTVLVPGTEALFSFYKRGGYAVCSHVGILRCVAQKSPLLLRAITAEEYGMRRRELLPLGGVIQEGENLSFLETQFSLYATDTAILAARQEGDALYGAELLGDSSQASAITEALGCRTGIFYTPTGDHPRAMYYPLRQDFLSPAYLGLAFD